MSRETDDCSRGVIALIQKGESPLGYQLEHRRTTIVEPQLLCEISTKDNCVNMLWRSDIFDSRDDPHSIVDRTDLPYVGSFVQKKEYLRRVSDDP